MQFRLRNVNYIHVDTFDFLTYDLNLPPQHRLQTISVDGNSAWVCGLPKPN